MTKDSRDRLPLTIHRRFQPSRYQVSHQELVLSTGAPGKDTQIEVLFDAVLAMNLRWTYGQLQIFDAGRRPEIERFVEIPEQHDDKYLRLVVSDGTHEGYVVCGSIHIREHPPG